MKTNDAPIPAKTELLAPAGQPDAGYAALHYGADAVYCGLAEFSARAEAVNFTPAELAVFTRHAHSLIPKRKVYLTLNTLISDDEFNRALDAMTTALDCGADAIIVQDPGLAKTARDFFPNAELHASTQMAIHSLDGVRAALRLGFRRVTLARELTLAEIAAICAESGAEVECFIHGTLCYAYSGLCLFSALTTGRSGNRGRCVYSCREAARTPAGTAHPFSLKDLALGADVLALARAGVKSLKIEGRKKSPLYVAATVDYYRRLLDGALAPGGEEEAECRARLQTIFARPWTKLFFQTRSNADVADTEVVGHRGAALGAIKGFTKTPAGTALRFRPSRALERHDGLQIDIPGESRPFGFAVDNLYIVNKNGMESAFAAPGGADIAVALPPDAPALEAGLPVYQSSSQAVKRAYPFARARQDALLPDIPVRLRIRLERAGEEAVVSVSARAALPSWVPARDGAPEEIAVLSVEDRLPAFAARDAAGAESAARKAFSRTGGSRFFLSEWVFLNPDALFLRPGDWNSLRRDALSRLEEAYADAVSAACASVRTALARKNADADARAAESPPPPSPLWSLVLEDAAQCADFADDDWDDIAEIAIDAASPDSAMEQLAARAGRDKLRLSLPFIVRADETGQLRERVEQLLAAGWKKWLVPGLGQREWLADSAAGESAPDLAADWSLYAQNAQAIAQLESLGFSTFSFSPEDSPDNIARLARRFPGKGWLTVHGDIPLFLSAACAHKNLGLCNAERIPGTCLHPGGMPVAMEKSGEMEILPQRCGSVVLPKAPFSLLPRQREFQASGVGNFRVDLRWRPRTPRETLAIWRALRQERQHAQTQKNRRRP